jgi:hypothetical protein
LSGQKCTSVAGRQVLSMQPAHEVHLLADFRQGSGRERDRAVLVVMESFP